MNLERLMSKISCQTANCRDLIAFKQSIGMISPIKELIKAFNAALLKSIEHNLDELTDLYNLIEASIIEEGPISIKEGNIIKDGYNNDVDIFRKASLEGKNWLLALESKERELTGIKNLKVNYNKVFGYYIEVTKSYIQYVPTDRYTRKQTLANAERYITPELKEMENIILGAEEKVVALEYEIFTEIRDKLAEQVERIKKSAVLISTIDSICFTCGGVG